MLRDIRTIFFDYDGCLHDSIKIYAPAFIKAYARLVDYGLAKPRIWTEREISRWIGMNSRDMWNECMPYLDKDMVARCSAMIGDEMLKLIRNGQPIWYEGAHEILSYLKSKRYRLVLVSNCKTSYMQAHRARFGLDRYFEAFATAQAYDFIPKHAIVHDICSKYPTAQVMIGDREQDVIAGKKNGMFVIGCAYGYGRESELDKADVVIEHIEMLKKLL